MSDTQPVKAQASRAAPTKRQIEREFGATKEFIVWMRHEDRDLLKRVAERLRLGKSETVLLLIRQAAAELGVTDEQEESQDSTSQRPGVSTPDRAVPIEASFELIPPPVSRDAADVLADVYALILGWPTPEERSAARSDVSNITDHPEETPAAEDEDRE